MATVDARPGLAPIRFIRTSERRHGQRATWPTRSDVLQISQHQLEYKYRLAINDSTQRLWLSFPRRTVVEASNKYRSTWHFCFISLTNFMTLLLLVSAKFINCRRTLKLGRKLWCTFFPALLHCNTWTTMFSLTHTIKIG